MITIRRPTEEDAADLTAMVDELNLHLGDPTGHFTTDHALRDVIAADAPLQSFVAGEIGSLSGYLLWHFAYESSWAARGGYICDLYVREPHRGSDLAHRMLCAAARAIDAGGGTYIWLTAHRTNDRARAFYRKHMEEADIIVAYAAAHEDFSALLGDESS